MIVQRQPDGRILMDREALAVWLERPADGLPLRGRTVARDPETRAALYDAQAVADTANGPRRRGPRLAHLIQVATRQTRPT